MKRFVVLGLLTATACGAPLDEEAEPGASQETRVSGELLQLGDQGPDVAEVVAYYSKRGYFENDRLRENFPDWKPLIGAPPVDPNVFDDALESAVRLHQARMGLPETGVVDEELWQHIRAPHCGVPDSPPSSTVDKWARWISIPWRTNSSYTYSLNLPSQLGRLSRSQAERRLEFAFDTWGGNTSKSMVRADGPSADIQVNVTTHDGRGGDYAFTNPFNGDIFLDSAEDWDTFERTDLATVALHEIGHSMGFDHSSVVTAGELPLMWSELATDELRGLNGDDFDALSVSPYTLWHPLSGKTANDIGAGNHEANFGHGEVWITSRESHSNGFRIYHYNPFTPTWELVDGGALRLDVSGRVPWVVTNDGRVFSRTGVTSSNPTGSGWAFHGDPNATDIGINTNGVAWVINNQPVSGHGNGILRYNGGGSWTQVDGGARRIAVAPNGAPFVVTDLGHVYFRTGVTSSSPLGNGWARLTGHPANVTDIALDPSSRGTVWVAVSGSSSHAEQWNLQQSRFNTPLRDTWYEPAGTRKSVTNISVGGFGRPLIVDGNRNVSWRLPPQN